MSPAKRWLRRRARSKQTVVEVLGAGDLPSMFRATDGASMLGRDSTYRMSAAYLSALVVAAVGPLLSERSFDKHFDYGAALSLASFAVAVVIVYATASRKPEARWYRGRAGAESVKSLAWCYAVGAEPFPLGMTDARAAFGQRLSQLRHELSDLDWSTATGDQITSTMDSLRGSDLPTRTAKYIAGRLDNQERWYADKAEANADAGSFAAALVIGTGVLGGLFGLAELTGAFNLDALGVCAAGAAAISAWAQVKQHRTFASAYAIAAQDLSLAREAVKAAADENDWATAAAGAEDAISREHTMWLARHGQRPLPNTS